MAAIICNRGWCRTEKRKIILRRALTHYIQLCSTAVKSNSNTQTGEPRMGAVTFNPGDKVLIKGTPHDYRRIDQVGTVNYRLPYEQHYYSVRVGAHNTIVNDSMMEHDNQAEGRQ